MPMDVTDRLEAQRRNVIDDAFRGSTSQIVSIIDVISEGPIEGLVEGQSSIFLNDDRIVPSSQTAVPRSTYTISLTSGSSVASLNKELPITEPDVGTRYAIIEGYKSSTVTIVDAQQIFSSLLINISTVSAFFDMSLVGNSYEAFSKKARLVSSTGKIIEGYVSAAISTTAAFFVSDYPYAVTESEYTLFIDYPLPISSFSGTTVNLGETPAFSGTFSLRVTGTQQTPVFRDVNDSSKYSSVTTQFRVGNLYQPVLSQLGGTGSVSVSNASFGLSTLEQSSDYGGEGSNIVLLGTSSAGFGLTVTQAKEVDEIRLIINYPGGLYSTSSNTAETYPSYAFYKFLLEIKRGGVWQSSIVLEENKRHKGSETEKGGFAVEEIFNLEPFAPFEDFRLTISRRSREDGTSILADGSDADSKYTQVATAALSTVTSVIKEPLWYPYTSYAAITFNSKDFQSPPSRTYHARGRRVSVPSNYVTREESASGLSSYNRNVSTGVVGESYQNWDGTFRSEVYTNNPAWVFYDLVLNNRYGLGNWIQADDIDKYALYRIARYCDELVPDGKGGMEPRFAINLYLTKAADSYKVLKDLATVFRGMLYWLDDSLTAIIDEPEDPIYTFSLGNVINGEFSYESSGSKTRINQVVVTWNNPDSDYNLESLIVEDRDNIIETGRILSQDSVAIGTTSEGQATRYGRWKLWTANNQTELVSFQTSINATFLSPGNIINVQDTNRFNISYSGRIPSEGTISSTQIPIDRFVDLTPNSTYELSIIINKPGTFLTQDSATIDGVTYSKGDLLDSDYTEIEASNLLDASGDSVLTSWREYTRVETKEVSTPASNTKVLEVLDAFSVIPERSAIWALKEILPTGQVNSASVKQYKILTIVEDEKNLHSIVAVEHYNEKFDFIDKDFVSSSLDTVYVPPRATTVVPLPRFVSAEKLGESVTRTRLLKLKWTQPSNDEYISGYEISHPFPSLPSPITVGKDTKYFIFEDIFAGSYTLGVRAINSRSNKSEIVKALVTVGEANTLLVPRAKGIPLGGIASIQSYLTDTGVYKFEEPPYIIAPPGAPNNPIKNVLSTNASYSQDCSNIPGVNFGGFTSAIEAEIAAHYILFDYDDPANPIKLIKYYIGAASGIPFWYDTGTGNDNVNSSFEVKAGTVTAVNNNVVLGSGTNFLTDYQEGDIIYVGAEGAVVVSVESNTKLTIDRPVANASGAFHQRQKLRIDPDFDCILAQVKNDTVDGFQFTNYVTLNSGIDKNTRLALLSSKPPFINYDSFEVLATDYTNIVLTAKAEGFDNPEFKVTGAGFSNPEISQTAEVVFSAGVDKIYTKTLDKVDQFYTSPLEFTVTVREKNDPNNTIKTAVSTIQIPLVKFAGQKTFYQETAPVSGMVTGDFWIRDSDNRYHRYNGTSWVEIQDGEFDVLLADIVEAQATADGKIQSFYQISPPGAVADNLGSGDLWFDTDDNDTIYRWNGTSWILAADDRIALAINDAATAQATADGKVVTFVSSVTPTAEAIGDLWLHTGQGNKLYRWNGSSWVDVHDAAIDAASNAASTAQGTADNALSVANSAYNIAYNLDYALKVSGTTILKGVIQPGDSGALKTGTITWNVSGALTGGTGVAITQWGIITAAAGVATFSLQASTGKAIFAGDVNTAGQIIATGTSTSSGFNAGIIANPSNANTVGVVGLSGTNVGVYAISTSNTGMWAQSNSTSSAHAGIVATASSGARSLKASGGHVQIDSDLGTDPNLLMGAPTTVGDRHVIMQQASTAGGRVTGQAQLYAALSATGNTILGITTWQSAEGSAAFTQSHRHRFMINGVEYYIPLQAV